MTLRLPVLHTAVLTPPEMIVGSNLFLSCGDILQYSPGNIKMPGSDPSEAIKRGCIVVKEVALRCLRQVRDDLAEGIEMRRKIAVQAGHRKVAAEHAAFGAEGFDHRVHNRPIALHRPIVI